MDDLETKLRDLDAMVVKLVQYAAEVEGERHVLREAVTSHAAHLSVLHRVIIEMMRQHPTVLDLVRIHFKELPDPRLSATTVSMFDSLMADLNAPE